MSEKNDLSETLKFNTIHQRVVNKLRNLPVEKLLAVEVLIDENKEKNHGQNKKQKPDNKQIKWKDNLNW